MNRGIRFFILIGILLSFTACKKSKVDIVYDKKYVKEIKELREELAFYLERNFIPGGSFAVARDGKIIYSEGLGMASKELNVKVNRSTKFRIAEVSELFTSVIYQLMVQEGTLNPDSSVQNYYSEFPKKKYDLTLKNLAYHSSGIRRPNRSEQDWNGTSITLQRGIDNFKNDTLIYEPGYIQFRSTFNYDLLGAIMEKISNKTYAALLTDFITDTLQLKNTEVDHPYKTINGRTEYFDNNIVAMVVNAPFCDLRSRAPSEGILSNAEDLVKFGNAILLSDGIPSEVKERLFESITLKSGQQSRFVNGWVQTKTNNGRTIYGMSGSVTGGGATLLILPDENIVVAATINLTSEMNDLPVTAMTEPFIEKE